MTDWEHEEFYVRISRAERRIDALTDAIDKLTKQTDDYRQIVASMENELKRFQDKLSQLDTKTGE